MLGQSMTVIPCLFGGFLCAITLVLGIIMESRRITDKLMELFVDLLASVSQKLRESYSLSAESSKVVFNQRKIFITDSFLLSYLIFELSQIHIFVSEAYEVELLLTLELKIDGFLHIFFNIIRMEKLIVDSYVN